MKVFLVCCTFLVFTGLYAAGQADAADKADKQDKVELPADLFRAWRHSREEDKDGVKVYRPADFDFPRARGVREGLEFKKDGKVTLTRGGPANKSIKHEGTWKAEGKDTVALEFKSDKVRPLKLRIVSCDAKVLKVKEVKEVKDTQ